MWTHFKAEHSTDLVPQAAAIVSSSFFRADLLGLDPLPSVDRVIGNPQKISGRLRDHYGFSKLSSVEY